MKPIRLILIPLLAAVLTPLQAMAEEFTIDTAHSFVQFKASHLGYAFIIGRFNTFEGNFSYDTANPGAASVNVTIDATSLDSNHAERDRHLRSDDFFHVRRYPEITFSSTGFQETGDGAAELAGDLSLHGVTRPVTIQVRHVGHGDDPWGGYRRGLEGEVTLNVADFGFPPWVGEVEIYLVVEGVRI